MARRTPDNFIKFNIGLKKGRTNQDVPLSDVHKALADRGFKIDRERVVTKKRAGGEPTAVIHARHGMSQDATEKSVHSMSGDLGQDAIAYRNNHKGVLSGPRKENYGGHFNSKFFTEGRLAESRADEMPGYLYRIGAETGNDLHLYKTSRMAHGDTSRYKDHVFHLGIHSIPDDVKARIRKDYPEARFGLSSASQYAPEMRSPVIVMPGAKKRIHESRLDELSPELKRRYVKAAADDLASSSELDAKNGGVSADLEDSIIRRIKGLARLGAGKEARRLAKTSDFVGATDDGYAAQDRAREKLLRKFDESVLEGRLDELSPDTLASYLRHAVISHSDDSSRMSQEVATNLRNHRHPKEGGRYAVASRRAHKRLDGILSAIDRLQSKSYIHEEDQVHQGDRVSVEDPRGDWTGLVFKPGRDSTFSPVSREESMHQITPDPQHAGRFDRSVVSVDRDKVHRVYEAADDKSDRASDRAMFKHYDRLVKNPKLTQASELTVANAKKLRDKYKARLDRVQESELDEISADTLHRYMHAANGDELRSSRAANAKHSEYRAAKRSPRMGMTRKVDQLKADMQWFVDRAARRRDGISLARNRLAKQPQAEGIDA